MVVRQPIFSYINEGGSGVKLVSNHVKSLRSASTTTSRRAIDCKYNNSGSKKNATFQEESARSEQQIYDLVKNPMGDVNHAFVIHNL